MSSPCFAAMLVDVNNWSRDIDKALERRDWPTHEPLLNDAGLVEVLPVQEKRGARSGLPADIYIDGVAHCTVICRYCHALVLIPVSELP